VSQLLIAAIIGAEFLVEGLLLLVVRRLWPPPPAPWRRTALVCWGISAVAILAIIAVPALAAPGIGPGVAVAMTGPVAATLTLALTLARIGRLSRLADRLHATIDAEPQLVARMEQHWLLRRALRHVSRHRPGG
jgi:hypothetical protein